MGETQGWVRAWTELSSQPWREAGFDPATTAQLARLPDAFAVGSKGQWMMLQLREERTAVVPTDAEFELLKMEHQRENERLQRRAGVLRTIAFLMAFGVIAWAGWWAVKLYRHRDHLPHP